MTWLSHYHFDLSMMRASDEKMRKERMIVLSHERSGNVMSDDQISSEKEKTVIWIENESESESSYARRDESEKRSRRVFRMRMRAVMMRVRA